MRVARNVLLGVLLCLATASATPPGVAPSGAVVARIVRAPLPVPLRRPHPTGRHAGPAPTVAAVERTLEPGLGTTLVESDTPGTAVFKLVRSAENTVVLEATYHFY